MTKLAPPSDKGTPLEQPGDENDYEVGHRRPPVATRFKPGQSGNPKGRPKGAKNLSTLTLEKLQAKIPVRVAGRERRMSKAELGITKMVNRFAETGDPKLFTVFLKQLEGSPNGNERDPGQLPLAAAEDQESNKEMLAWFLEKNSVKEGSGS